MPRLQIELPASFPYATTVRVRVDDLNAGGHLANHVVLKLAQEARMRWLRALGFVSELDVDGAGLIMTDAAVVFRAEGTYGMDLRIEVAPDRVRNATFNLLYRLSDEATGAEVARVQTGMAFFDYARRRPTGAPERFRAAVSRGTP